MLIALLALGEILLLSAGALVWVQRAGGSRLDALALCVPLSLGALSCLYQAAFLVQLPQLSFPVEVLLAAFALRAVVRDRVIFGELGRATKATLLRHPLVWGAIVLVGACLALQAICLEPIGRDALSYHLPRVLLFQQESSLFPAEFSKYDLVVKTLGADILSHIVLRFYEDQGAAFLPLLAYVAIICGGYAMARRHASEANAALAALVIAGMPQLVHQSAVFKSNVFAAMVGVAVLLLGHRLVEGPRTRDVLALVFMMAFGVATRPNFVAFAAAFGVCFGVLAWRRRGDLDWRPVFQGQTWAFLAWVIPVVILSQVWLFVHNYWTWGGYAGPSGFVEFHRNHEGLMGAAANLVRYAFQSLHLLAPADWVSQAWTGHTISESLESIYDAWWQPLFGDIAISATFRRFHLNWMPRQAVSWYGPLGFALVLPSLFYAAWRGTPLLRATSLVLMGYGLAFSYVVTWFPYNARMLSPVFAGALPCVAFALDRIALGGWGRRILTGLAVLILLWSIQHTRSGGWIEPVFSLVEREEVPAANVGPELQTKALGLPPGSRVALIVDNGTPLVDFFLENPQSRLTPVWPWLRKRMDPDFDLEAFLIERDPPFDMVLCLAVAEPVCVLDGRASP
ncbi:glycosyltransferase family 39 protein [Myxococcota bacterium]|nr:glycosyltransferase family 39 protein [Myxococcota bacterium]